MFMDGLNHRHFILVRHLMQIKWYHIDSTMIIHRLQLAPFLSESDNMLIINKDEIFIPIV